MKATDKPKIFIGCSREQIEAAETLKKELDRFAISVVFPDAFSFGKSTLHELFVFLAIYDYAIFLAGNDDTTVSRRKKQESPRDNVVFEYGLFAGALGSERVFYMREKDSKLPSDLLGIGVPSYPKVDMVLKRDGLTPVQKLLKKKQIEIQRKAIVSESKKIIKQIKDLEQVTHPGLSPSSVLAIGYFKNFLKNTIDELISKVNGKTKFVLESKKTVQPKTAKFTVYIPNDLKKDMFSRVREEKHSKSWDLVKLDPNAKRPFDFHVSVDALKKGVLHLIDIPITLNALFEWCQLYYSPKHIGKVKDENLIEAKEIRNFARTLKILATEEKWLDKILFIESVSI